MIRGFFKKEVLDQLTVKPGNRFTNQYPYTEVPVSTYIDSYSIGHLLFDLKNDPKQEHPIKDKKIENKMIRKLVEIMDRIEVTDSEYERLGLEK